MRRLSGLMVVAVALFGASRLGWAQEYPNRPVRIVVPYAAGGAPDVIARLLGQRFGETLGQAIVVENRPGAGGIAATEFVARSAPDGYTLLLPDIPQLALNPYLFRSLPYDPVRDFAPISIVATTPMFVVVRSDAASTSMGQLIAEAKARPGHLTYASAGIGSLHHIAMESIKAGAGIDLVHVPYKGTGQAVPALISGEVAVLVSTLAAVEPHVRSGQVRLLAGTPARRTVRLPDVPAVAETVPGIDFAGEMGLLAPAGTPTTVVNRLALEVQRALRTDEVARRLASLGAVAVGSTPEAYASSIRTHLGVFERAVRAARLSPE